MITYKLIMFSRKNVDNAGFFRANFKCENELFFSLVTETETNIYVPTLLYICMHIYCNYYSIHDYIQADGNKVTWGSIYYSVLLHIVRVAESRKISSFLKGCF